MKRNALAFALMLTLSIGLATPTLAVNGTARFTDVPADNWAYPYVEKAAENGWISGYTDGRFGPDDKVTYAQFCVMLIGGFFQGQLAEYDGPSDTWYAKQCGTAAELGLFDYSTIKGNHTDATTVSSNMNRYEMAAILYPAFEATVHKADTDALGAAQAVTADWSSIPDAYKTSVAVAKTYGLINGVDAAGTFSGDGTMNRAQAAVVLCKLDELIQENQQTGPTPQNPDADPNTSATIIGQEADELLFSKEHVRFYYTGWEKNADGYEIKLRIENDSDYKISGGLRYSVAKNKEVSMSLVCAADPGRTSEGKILISNEAMQKAGLDDFKTITVRFRVYETQNIPYRLDFETGNILIKLEAASEEEPEPTPGTDENVQSQVNYSSTVQQTEAKPSATTQVQTEPSVSASRTVYVTRTGKKYHYSSTCNGGTYYASTLSEARSRGLTPCNKCVN